MIFNLFKSKPSLKELIPKGFTDIHSHILPGIDDGAKNISESLTIIRELKKIGFEKIYCTPHTYPGLYDNTSQNIKSSFEILNENLNFKIKIEYASEYFTDYSLLEKIKQNSLLTIKKNYILIETGFTEIPFNFFEIIFRLQTNGYNLILAHPERYNFLQGNIKLCEKLKTLGVYFQLNLFSTTGFYGKEIAKFGNFLLRENFIDFVGSDIHNMKQLKIFENKITINESDKLQQALANNNKFY